jgi:hypothetical protein
MTAGIVPRIRDHANPSRAETMTGTPMPPPRDDTDYRQRFRVNLIAGVAIIFLLALVFVTVKLFSDQQKLETCFASGRRNCVDIAAPPRTSIIVPAR